MNKKSEKRPTLQLLNEEKTFFAQQKRERERERERERPRERPREREREREMKK